MNEMLGAATLQGWWAGVIGASAASGLVLLAVLALDLLLARKVSARWRVALYLAVLARVLLPGAWTSPFGLAGSAAPARIAADVGETVVPAPISAAAPPVASDPAAASKGAAPLVLHASVAAALLLAWAFARLLLARRLRDVRDASERVRAHAPAGLPVVEHATLGPAVFGILRPRVVVPSPLVRELDDDALSAVLRHEAAHVARRDPLVLALMQVFTFAAWPLLPVWCAAWRVRGLMEQACDEAALRGAAAQGRRAYGEALIRVAEWQPLRARLALGMLAFGGGLAPRLRQLRVTRRWNALAQGALVVAGASLVVMASGARRVEAEELETVPFVQEVYWGGPASVLGEEGNGVIVNGKDGLRLHAGTASLSEVAALLLSQATRHATGQLNVPVGIGYVARYPLPDSEDAVTLTIEPSHQGLDVSWTAHADGATLTVPLAFGEGEAAVLSLTSPRSSSPVHVVISRPSADDPAPEPSASQVGGIDIARFLLERHCQGDVAQAAASDGLTFTGRCPTPLDLANFLRDLEDRFDFRGVALVNMQHSADGTAFTAFAAWQPAVPFLVEIETWQVNAADMERLFPPFPGAPVHDLPVASSSGIRIEGLMHGRLPEVRVELARLLQERRATPLWQEEVRATAGDAVRAHAGEVETRRRLELSVTPTMGLQGIEAGIVATWSGSEVTGRSSSPSVAIIDLGDGDVVLAIVQARRRYD